MTEKQETDRLARQIDDNLKKVYRRTMEEDVPDRFLDLLAKLRDADEGSSEHGK